MTARPEKVPSMDLPPLNAFKALVAKHSIWSKLHGFDLGSGDGHGPAGTTEIDQLTSPRWANLKRDRQNVQVDQRNLNIGVDRVHFFRV